MTRYFSLGPSGSGGTEVYAADDDGVEELDTRLDLVEHSPTGFSWGYSGSGPAQLALAVLAHHGGDDYALRNYQEFKTEVVAAQDPQERFFVSDSHIDGVVG